MPHKDPEKRRAYYREYQQRPENKAKKEVHRALWPSTPTPPTRIFLSAEEKKLRKRQYQIAWRKKNPELAKSRSAEAHRRWLEKHGDRAKQIVVKSVQKWRNLHPEESRQSARDYRRKNAIAVRIREGKKTISRYNAPGSHTAQDVQACLTMQGHRCFYCLASLLDGYHVDHMTPISRGGTHDPDNIVCACPPCNLKKHDKTAAEFILGLKRAA